MKLDEYQIEGAGFLASRSRAGLFDTMGVGKTCQAVVACDNVRAKLIVVVCQAAKRLDWYAEFDKFSLVRRPVSVIQGKHDIPISDGINLVSYDMAHIVIEYFRTFDLRADVLIIDEIQFLKSPDANRTKMVLGKGGIATMADRVWLLSGSPMLNHPGEMWPWLYTLFPAVIDRMSYDAFVDRYCNRRITDYGVQITGGKNLPELRKRIEAVYLRRDESVVSLPELLPFEELPIAFEPNWQQEWDELVRLEGGRFGTSLKNFIKQMEMGDEPDLSAEMTVVRDGVARIRRLTGILKAKPIAGLLIDELSRDTDKKVGIFCHHKDVIELIYSYLTDAGIDGEKIWGGMDPIKRDRKIKAFAGNKYRRFMIAQTHAIGTGVDGLQHGACDVIMAESDWVPLVNLQAIKRYHRRGQRHPVRVRFPHLVGSMDQQIQRIQRRKTTDFAALFG